MSNTVVIIPSRLNAKRLPNKPLKLINGKEMILHVHDLAKNSKVGSVLVVTPDKDIAELIKKMEEIHFSLKINTKPAQIGYSKGLKIFILANPK